MNEKKKILEKLVNEECGDSLSNSIDEYEKEYPYDIDIIKYRMINSYNSGDYDSALEYALSGERKLPLNAYFQLYLGLIYSQKEMPFESLTHLNRANHLFMYESKDSEILPLLESLMQSEMQKIENNASAITDPGEVAAYIEKIKAFNFLSGTSFGLQDGFFRNPDGVTVGKYYYQDFEHKKYIGIYKDQYFDFSDNRMNLIYTKGEFVDVVEGTEFSLTECNDEGADYLVPIASENKDTVHKLISSENLEEVLQHNPHHFSYYRLAGGSKIKSSGLSYYGNPVCLKKDPDKKQLVLNIFVDGLAECILKGDILNERMPNTAKFFENGLICENAYATGEWTFPSLGAFVTGYDTTHHMMFHSDFDSEMPKDVKTLAESFKEAGYHTSKICGNWRIIPTYGHDRGYDTFIYQHQKVGFKVQEIIGETINQIEAFKDTNQFVWMSIGDLHDVADHDDLAVSVQSKLSFIDRSFDVKSTNQTSAKQPFSPNKRKMLEKDITFVDMWLGILFNYLKENYDDKDIVVSLFSDHGQGYLVDDNSHFLAGGRASVAFMFKGSKLPNKGRDYNIHSIADYSYIMRELCDVEQPSTPTDGFLTDVFGGNKVREYAITDSIHPGDPYQAALHTKDLTFYFVNDFPVTTEGRFELSNYRYWLEDNDAQVLPNEQQEKYYLDIILDHIKELILY